MAGSAVFVLSSAWEGLPTVLIEAIAANPGGFHGLPQRPEGDSPGRPLGALVPVGDAAALAAATLEALDQPRSAIPTDALLPFTRDASVDHYLRVIERAAPGHAHRPPASASNPGLPDALHQFDRNAAS